MNKTKDHFANKAKEYDKEVKRVGNVTRIAELMKKTIEFTKDMHIMDFGSGSGLLLERIAPLVGHITAVDISPAMNEVLESKREKLSCKLTMLELDLSQSDMDQTFDGIISSMTLHHIKDIKAIFEKFYSLLSYGGTLALADLDIEDGSFHTEDTGVFHFGFDRDWLANIAKEAGFTKVNIQTVANVVKPHGEYPVFLLTAQK